MFNFFNYKNLKQRIEYLECENKRLIQENLNLIEDLKFEKYMNAKLQTQVFEFQNLKDQDDNK